MKEKLKLLSIGRKKAKASSDWEKVVEIYAPGMYDLFYGAGEKDALKQVRELHPEIVLILASMVEHDPMDGLRLLEEIKHLQPQAAVFVIMGVVDNEQEVFDEYLGCGAYKCYASPVSMDALFHDMFVALHLE